MRLVFSNEDQRYRWQIDEIVNPYFVKDYTRNNYRFVIEEISPDNGKYPLVSSKVLIGLRNLEMETWEYHPISAYLFEVSKIGLKAETLRQYALLVMSFLNHIFIDYANEYQLNDLTELTFEHGRSFLNYCIFNEEREGYPEVGTIERKHGRLSNFYYYLCNEFKMKNVQIERIKISKTPYGTVTYNAPFAPNIDALKEIKSQQGSRMKILHGLPFSHIPMFLFAAIRRRPEIALAIYFGIFGGLRAGEVCNIRHQDITAYIGGENGEYGLLIPDLRTRIVVEGPNGVTTKQGKVKKAREQKIYNINNMLVVLYKRHKKLLAKWYLNSGGIDLGHAVFINRDGKPMTADALYRAFLDVKDYYLNSLDNGNADDIILARNLARCKWAFHIGRGMFSNIIAKSGANPLELMFSRGDSSLLSCLPYLQGEGVQVERIEQLMDRLNLKFNSHGEFEHEKN